MMARYGITIADPEYCDWFARMADDDAMPCFRDVRVAG